MPAWAWILLASASLYGLHRLACWMEDRGWIYWRKDRGWATRAGSAALEIQQLLEPSKRHVIQVKREQRKKQDAQGEPPKTGKPPGMSDERTTPGP